MNLWLVAFSKRLLKAAAATSSVLQPLVLKVALIRLLAAIREQLAMPIRAQRQPMC